MVHDRDAVSGQRIGFFKSAYALRRDGLISENDSASLDELLDWFDANLDAPDRFSKSRRAHADEKALSWFKPCARLHIAKSRELLALLRTYEIHSDMLTSSKPGVVVYEDDIQIAAIPFRDVEF